MQTDAELLNRYAEEHAQDAFALLVQQHLPMVYGTALRRVGYDAHLAEDVAQIVFSDLARKAASLRGRTTLTGWLIVSTHRAAAAVVRSEQRRKTRELAAHTMQSLLPESKAAGEAERLRPLLDDAIVQLPAHDREAIALRFLEQRSFADVAAALRLTEDAARKRVDRALDKLRRILSRRGVTSTGALLAVALTAPAVGTPPAALPAKITGRALAHAISAGPGVAAWSGAILAGACIIAGIGAIIHQRQLNFQLVGELAQLDARAEEMAAARTENRQLARVLAETDELRRAQAELPHLRAAAAPAIAKSASQAPVKASVTISADGTLRWAGKPVSLREFLIRLTSLEQNAPEGEAKLSIRSFGQFQPTAYVIEQTRMARIKHVVAETSGTLAIDPKAKGPFWFDLP